MKIILNRINLLNFKGIRSLEINFNQETNISGDNATGKTTIMDAFLWLLFGKDSTDREDFEIKTLDANNQPFWKMDHEVSGNFSIDDEDVTIKRTFIEKWVKKRGETEAVFSGHDYGYFWNDVPYKAGEFQSKINAIMPETLFKLITNTGYFNKLKWQDRRRALLLIAGEISNDQVVDRLTSRSGAWGIQNKSSWSAVVNALNSKKNEDEFKREIVVRKKRIKDELDMLPTRISEAQRNLPEVPELGYEKVEQQLNQRKEELVTIDGFLMDATTAQKERGKKVAEAIKDLQQLKNDRTQIEFRVKNSIRDKKQTREQVIADLERQINNLSFESKQADSSILIYEGRKKGIAADQAILRGEWNTINGKKLEFDDNDFHCPACKRAFEESDINSKKTELTNNFNANKSKQLAANVEKGRAMGVELKELDNKITELKNQSESVLSRVETFTARLNSLKETHASLVSRESLEIERNLAVIPEFKSLTDKIINLEAEINKPAEKETDNSAMLQRKKDVNEEIFRLKKQLDSKETRELIIHRVSELEAQEKQLANELANQEGIEFSIDQFIKAKMDTLEERINGRFQIVKFKLFHHNINGGTEECCDALVDGVPYSDVNTAGKINAGLDVINTLCQHYQKFAPVFVDNAESVNSLIPVKSQIIRLIVTKDKRLKIESPAREMAEAIQ